MTAKEKANDLVNQYRMILMDEDTDCGNEILCTLIAIKSARITANEMIDQIYKSGEMSAKAQIKWWELVRSELQSF